MAIKKSALYRSLWDSCDQLRGGMDASQYKDYVLAMLFIKYVSDKYANQTLAEVTVPKGATFNDMIALKNKPDIGDKINKNIISPLEKENGISGMPDFNDDNKLGKTKEKIDRLTRLIGIFQRPELNFAANRAEDDDILGDAYEYLMRNFAAESGKSKGQFYTPAEVSRLIAKVLLSLSDKPPRNNTTFYDPTCGSGSLLLRINAEANGKGTLYGQEKDSSTVALARMNTILHKMATAEIRAGNTLTSPEFLQEGGLKTFDYVVANPPFSDKAWSTGMQPSEDIHRRFEMGVPPPKQGDYAYLLHIINSLRPRGKGACILPHGVLFRGNAEAVIRKNLLNRGYIRAIIGLPSNLFYGTGIPACIVLLDRENAGAARGVFFINAANGFIKDGNKNRLRDMDIRRIADALAANKDIPRYARMASPNEIAHNDYNLNIPRYINNSPPENIQDINGHLHGGIPAADIESLTVEFPIFANIKEQIFKLLHKGYYTSRIPSADIPASIINNANFQTLIKQMEKHFNKWQEEEYKSLYQLKKGCRPKNIIAKLGDSILNHYNKKPIDPYRAYQYLMELWNDKNMEDDCYLIAANGWQATPESIIEKGKEISWECDLLPKALIIDLYFAEEQTAINNMQEQAEATNARRAELEEEHNGDDGLLDNFNFNKTNVINRLKEIDNNDDDEAIALQKWRSLYEKENEIKKQIKQAIKILDNKAYAHYETLTEDDIKECVINHKWFAMLDFDMRAEVENMGHTLSGRLRTLSEDYETPLTTISTEVTECEKKVNAHLRQMGFTL